MKRKPILVLVVEWGENWMDFLVMVAPSDQSMELATAIGAAAYSFSGANLLFFLKLIL